MNNNILASNNYNILKQRQYPGRAIAVGQSPDGKSLMQVDFVTGRSVASRQRVLVMESGVLRTKPSVGDMDDPLRIYTAARDYEGAHILTNGDQTDTIYDGLQHGAGSVYGRTLDALMTRTYEPDSLCTPRISSVLTQDGYLMSVLKSTDKADGVSRQHFCYTPLKGFGHYFSTYDRNAENPPSWQGEPLLVPMYNTIEETLDAFWSIPAEDFKVAMYVAFHTGDKRVTRLINTQ